MLVIYYQNNLACNAGILTVLRNRVGDVAILMGIGLEVTQGSFRFLPGARLDFWVVVLVVVAGVTKRAQIPFSAWLPAAMAAPTPVSALVHSSTLVTAGVYLLIRFNVALTERGLNTYLLGVALITMLMAGVRANLETDLKKVVALSTLSQLGLIIMTLRIGLPGLAFFHLITHAIFKSTLFMCVGFMIHSAGGTQDGRKIRGLGLAAPFLGVVFRVTNIALAGLPFLAGFYSKDIILELAYSRGRNMFIFGVVVLATGLTISYSVRVLYLSRAAAPMFQRAAGRSEADGNVISGVRGLLLGSVLGGHFFA